MIKNILDEVDPLVVAVLINAVYFKGEWANKFDKANTREMDFHLAGGTSVPCKVLQSVTGIFTRCIIDSNEVAQVTEPDHDKRGVHSRFYGGS
eukprot:5842568-Pyramimonas_sp.AAC.1